jgi:subfamily B ATP-binding cassette protein MsbA
MPQLVLVFLLGTFSAFAQRSVVLFVYPAVELLFPKPHSELRPPPSNRLAGVARDAQNWLVGQPRNQDEKIAALFRIALVLVLCGLVIAPAQYCFIVTSRRVGLRMILDLRMRVTRHLLRLSMAYHGRRHLGDLLSRVATDVAVTLYALNHSLRELVLEPLLGLTSLVLAAFIAPVPTLFVVVGLAIVAVPVARQSRAVRRGSAEASARLGAAVQTLTQIFQGIRAVKAFRAEKREMLSFRRANEDHLETTMKVARTQAGANVLTVLLSQTGMAVLVVMLGWLTIRHGVFGSEKDMAAFFLCVATMYGSVRNVMKEIAIVMESAGSAERIQSLFDEQPDVVEKPGARTINGLGAGLRFEQVRYAYPGGHGHAVVDFDLQVRPGETLALVGPSGAGKSTVVDLVARFIDPTQGRICVDGIDLTDLTLDSWTAQYAMVGQTPFLFHATIGENIRYGRPEATQSEVEQAAHAAGIHDFIATLPEGYETDVADAGSRLSGGQRQRITIARAFLKGAPLLLLDEATSALDVESEQVVQAALERLMVERTVIVIAHRLSTVRNADRIAVMEAGRVVEIGTHDELLAKGGSYARTYLAQFVEKAVPAG